MVIFSIPFTILIPRKLIVVLYLKTSTEKTLIVIQINFANKTRAHCNQLVYNKSVYFLLFMINYRASSFVKLKLIW